MKNKSLILILFSLLVIGINTAKADNIEDATNYYNQAIDLYNNNNTDKSIEMFSKAIQLYPDFYEANYNLAQILISINKNEEALEVLEKIEKLKPNDSETFYNIAKVQYRRGYLSKAHEYLLKIPQTAPQYESAKILIAKIEKRQEELNLEAKIQNHKVVSNITDKIMGVNLVEIPAPSGTIVDDNGNIYVASFQENIIYKITPTGQKTTFSNSNLIKGPIGLALDKENNLYIANYSANNIIKISQDTANISIFADIKKPYCITYDKEQNRLYATEQNTNKLVKFDL